MRLRALIDEFRSRDQTVYVITARRADLLAATTGPSGEIVLPVHGDSTTGVGLRRMWDLLVFGFAAWRKIRRLDPRIVVSDPPPTAGLAALATPAAVHVYYIADAWAEMLMQGGGSLSALLGRLVRPVETWVLRHTDLVIAVRENLAEFSRNAGARRVVTAPYGTDIATFTDEGPAWDSPWAGDRPYFVYAGNYGVIQGASVFLEAARRSWEAGLQFGLVFMGYGADQFEVDRLAADFPEHFRALAPQPGLVAAAAMRGSTAVLASMRPLDVAAQTRPAKALAGLATGSHLIFAGAGAFCNEVQDHELGLAVPWDSNAVAQAFVEMIERERSSPEGWARDRRQIARYARQHYDMRAVAAQLADCIEESMSHAG